MLTEAASRQNVLGVEIFANLFNAIVDEMAWIVLRSSHTTFVKETQDFAVALVTPEGDMFAYPYGRGATPMRSTRFPGGSPSTGSRRSRCSAPIRSRLSMTGVDCPLSRRFRNPPPPSAHLRARSSPRST